MNVRLWGMVCVFLIGSGGFACSSSYAFGTYRPQPCPRPEPPKVVERTVHLKAPVPSPPPPQCFVPPPCGYRPAPPVRPAPVPVRVNIAVTPECAQRPRMVPVAYRSPGPVKPIVTHAVGLAGALVAAPFMLADTVLPLYHPALTLRKPGCGPRRGRGGPAPYHCAPPRPCVPPIRKCAPPCPPRCPLPMTCAPQGPSVAPLPRPSCAPACGPYIPSRLVERSEYPCLEPRDLLSGLVRLPFRILERGRVFGDMNVSPGSRTCTR